MLVSPRYITSLSDFLVWPIELAILLINEVCKGENLIPRGVSVLLIEINPVRMDLIHLNIVRPHPGN